RRPSSTDGCVGNSSRQLSWFGDHRRVRESGQGGPRWGRTAARGEQPLFLIALKAPVPRASLRRSAHESAGLGGQVDVPLAPGVSIACDKSLSSRFTVAPETTFSRS